MPDSPTQAAVAAILAKRDSILEERAKTRAEMAALSTRDRELDRELADCRAAARLFGVALDLPEETSEVSKLRIGSEIFDRLRKSLAAPSVAYRNFYQAIEGADAVQGPPPPPPPVPTAEIKALAAIQDALNAPAEMPRISDVVLDRLKAAGSQGSKASPIQRYIESTYGKKIHDKTVGMTLYRLQKDGLVRRDGHTWFITEKVMNPGAVTPGLSKLFD